MCEALEYLDISFYFQFFFKTTLFISIILFRKKIQFYYLPWSINSQSITGAASSHNTLPRLDTPAPEGQTQWIPPHIKIL